MIEYVMMAFFVAQPPRAQGAPPTPGGTPAAARKGPAAPTDEVVITSKLAEGTGKQNQLAFIGNVRVEHRTLVLTCDRLVAQYSPRGQEVQRVECTGAVEAHDGERWAKGERATFDVPTGVLEVTGSPQAGDGTSLMAGTRVRFTLGSRNLSVDNARVILRTQGGKAPQLPPGLGGERKK